MILSTMIYANTTEFSLVPYYLKVPNYRMEEHLRNELDAPVQNHGLQFCTSLITLRGLVVMSRTNKQQIATKKTTRIKIRHKYSRQVGGGPSEVILINPPPLFPLSHPWKPSVAPFPASIPPTSSQFILTCTLSSMFSPSLLLGKLWPNWIVQAGLNPATWWEICNDLGIPQFPCSPFPYYCFFSPSRHPQILTFICFRHPINQSTFYVPIIFSNHYCLLTSLRRVIVANECLFQFDPIHINPELEISSYLFQSWIFCSPGFPTGYSVSALTVT